LIMDDTVETGSCANSYLLWSENQEPNTTTATGLDWNVVNNKMCAGQ